MRLYLGLGGMIAERKPHQFTRQLARCLVGHLRRQARRRFVHIPLLPALRKLKGFVQRIASLLTPDAVGVRTGQRHHPHHCLRCAVGRPSGTKHATTVGTGHRLPFQCFNMYLLHERLRDHPGQLLTHRKHRLRQLFQGGRVLLRSLSITSNQRPKRWRSCRRASAGARTCLNSSRKIAAPLSISFPSTRGLIRNPPRSTPVHMEASV